MLTWDLHGEQRCVGRSRSAPGDAAETRGPIGRTQQVRAEDAIRIMIPTYQCCGKRTIWCVAVRFKRTDGAEGAETHQLGAEGAETHQVRRRRRRDRRKRTRLKRTGFGAESAENAPD